MEQTEDIHLMTEHLDGTRFKPHELFNEAAFTTLLSALQNVNAEQHKTFVIDLTDHPLPESALESLSEDLSSIYNYSYFLECGFNWFNLLDSLVKLGAELESLEQELSDDYFNQDLTVGINKLLLKWPHSANYLHHRRKAIKKLHDTMVTEIINHVDLRPLVQFPGISLIAQSHTQWQDNLEATLNEKKSSIERYQYLVQMKARLQGVISDTRATYRRIDELVTEFAPGSIMLPDCWYEISSSRIKKHSNHCPDLDRLVTWLDRKIQTIIPTFTIKQEKKHKTASLAKEALKHKWRTLIVNADIEISVLDNFIDSNFRMAHQSDVVQLPYSFKITRQKDLKGLIKDMRSILEEFVVEENKTDKILWLYTHVGDSLTYSSVSDYMKRRD